MDGVVVVRPRVPLLHPVATFLSEWNAVNKHYSDTNYMHDIL